MVWVWNAFWKTFPSKQLILYNLKLQIVILYFHLNIVTLSEMRQSQLKKNQTQNKQFVNSPTEKTFMRYYQQNIQLKNKLLQKQQTIKLLKNKLQYQLNLNKTSKLNYQDTHKTSKQAMQKSIRKQNKTLYAPSESKKVQNLLQIIDHYKQKLLISQQEIQNLKRHKYLLQQDFELKGKRNHQNMASSSSGNFKPKIDQNMAQKLRQKTNQLQKQKQRNKWTLAQLKQLESKIKTLQLNSEELDQLKIENRRLQSHVLKLSSLSSNQNATDQIATEQRCKELQQKIKLINQKYNKLKDDTMKLNADYKLLENKLIQREYQNQQYQKEALRLKKLQIDNPILQKLARNPELLMKVVGQIEKPQLKPFNFAINPQQLVLQKEELARNLIQTQNKLKSMQENWRQKQIINKLEREQLMTRVNINPQGEGKKNYTSKIGVQYDGDISVFSDEKIAFNQGVNYFDIFLGKLNLLQTMVHSVANIQNSSNPLILATVDFYNHNTVNTKLTQGYDCDFHSQVVFKINEDSFFYKYLSKGSFKIDIWASQGNKNHHIGRVQVPLKSLLLKSKQNVAPVINTSAAIYLNQKIMGTINLDMRMRFPIHEHVQKILNINESNVHQENAPKRKLIIQIQQGSGFNQKSSLFVYYPFRLQDFYTKTAKGPSPKWNHYKMLDVIYDSDFKNYLRKNQIEITIFDDNAKLYDQKDSDVIGMNSVSLMPLLQDAPIKQKLQIKKNGRKIGYISIKIFWYQAKQKVDKSQLNQKVDYIQLINADIHRYIKENSSSPQNQFKRIDDNNTGMISFDELNIWLSKMKHSKKYSLDNISKFYDTFKQPLNMINFVKRLSEKPQDQKRSQDLIAEFGMINKFLKTNSVHIKNKISLQEYLKNKDLLEITLQIDKNKDGKISKTEFVQYLQKNNVDSKQVKDEVIHLTDFLQKYQKKV